MPLEKEITAEIESDGDVPLAKRRIVEVEPDDDDVLIPNGNEIAPGINIKVNCQLFLVAPKIGGDEPFRYVDPAAAFIFGTNSTSAMLGWPRYTRDDNNSDSDSNNSVQTTQVDDWGIHNHAEQIIKYKYKWVTFSEDILHVRVRVKLIDIERTSDNLSTNLISDMGRILGTGSASDVIIKCGSESFPAHKLILSLRSPVFKTMFQAEMLEAVSGIITIEDSEPFVLKQFLKFLYTAKVELSILNDDQIIGLIAAAEKYAVSDLKDFCFQNLLNKLDKDTCGQLAVAAYLYGAEKYQKDRIYKFFADRWKALGAKAEFQALVKAYPAAFLKP